MHSRQRVAALGCAQWRSYDVTLSCACQQMAHVRQEVSVMCYYNRQSDWQHQSMDQPTVPIKIDC